MCMFAEIPGVEVVDFSNGEVNALTSETVDKLILGLRKIRRETRIVLLKSKGSRAFCAGASFDEIKSVQSSKESISFFEKIAQLYLAIRNTEAVVVARVQGKAVGGGVGLIACSDYVFATQNAAVRLSELDLGIGPLIIEPILRRRMGVAATSELALSREWRDSAWCKQRGLFQDIEAVSEGQLDVRLAAFIQELASKDVDAVREVRRALWQGAPDWSQLLMERAKGSGELWWKQKEILLRLNNVGSPKA